MDLDADIDLDNIISFDDIDEDNIHSSDDADVQDFGEGNISTGESDNNVFSSPDVSCSIILEVGDVFKPVVGNVFSSLKDAFDAYQKYAKAAGFEARKSSQPKDTKGVVTVKYFVCSKQGSKEKKYFWFFVW